jgi:leader peptidase (prepilin peptidase)/N-methyltransferase
MVAVAFILVLASTSVAWRLTGRTACNDGVAIGRPPIGLLTAAAVVAALAVGRGNALVLVIAVVTSVTIAALIDSRTGYIFDRITGPFLLAALAIAAVRDNAINALIGMAAVAGVLVALYALTARRGIGLGDVKLGAGIGAALGWPMGSVALCAAFIIGGAYGAWLLTTGRAARQTAVPFGPFLALGTYVALLWPLGGI